MTLADFGSLGEIFGGLAVVITLIFLILDLKIMRGRIRFGKRRMLVCFAVIL